jgi:alkylation response protein AidB-like acyl-CoA dehydrogenase
VAALTSAVTESYAKDVDAYRMAIRDWLAEHKNELTAPVANSGHEYIAHCLQLSSAMWQAGWKRFGWPTSLGGLGGGPRHRATYYDELGRAGLEIPDTDLSIEVIGPAMVRFAPALADAFLPRLLAGQESWGQAFSEPEAGSDLASLRTRGVVTDGTVVVDGQKVWTSHGHYAERLLTLVRTGTSESRHRGLAALLIDSDSEGLHRNPLIFANGTDEMCETFFDSVRVPLDRMVGGPEQGWTVAMYMLQFERSMYAAQRQSFIGLRLRQLTDYLKEAGYDEGAEAAAGSAWLNLQCVRARAIESVRRLDAGETVGPDASADKVLLARAEQAVFELSRYARRSGFVFDEQAAEPWRAGWWYSRATSIFGGAGEIQRSIVADRVLKLPKEKVEPQ